MIHAPNHPDVEHRVLSAVLAQPSLLATMPNLAVDAFTTVVRQQVFSSLRNIEAAGRMARAGGELHAAILADLERREVLAVDRRALAALVEQPGDQRTRLDRDVETLELAARARAQIVEHVDAAACSE